MTYVISDGLDDALGRWEEIAPWDSTEYYQGTGGFLTTQSHVDLRNFRFVSGSPSESWTQSLSSGLNASIPGAVSARGGWSGMRTTTNGSAVNVDYESVALDVNSNIVTINISAMTHLSVIFPDYNAFDNTSYIQLSSSVDGSFGSGHDSAQVTFASNLSVMPQVLLNVSAFANAGFDNTKVTGVRIHLNKASAPAANQVVTFFAVRAFNATWGETALDFDTRIGGLCPSITLTATPYGGTTALAWEFIRGDGSKADPIPFDGGYNLFFYPGGSTAPNDASGGVKNRLGVIVREIKDTGAGTGSILEGRLEWDNVSTTFVCERIDMTGGPGGTRTTVGTNTRSVGGALDPAKIYVFRVELVGTTFMGSLYESNYACSIGAFVWSSGQISSSSYAFRSGRVGFKADLKSRDSFVLNYEAAPVGFAVLDTLQFNSYTPVDGAQLSAVFSQDLNLFTGVSGSDVVLDATKTLSGNGSYRASRPITTNSFVVEDWTQTYLSIAIWVGTSVTRANQPQLFLNTSGGSSIIRMDALLPNQWNNVEVDLDRFRALITGSSYSISIAPGATPDRALGFFWVDEILVGRRKVAWAIRATPGGLYREFKGMTNQTWGSVHLNPNERGTELQLQARALTSDAWIAKGGSTRLIPHYAEKGNFVFDQAFDT